MSNANNLDDTLPGTQTDLQVLQGHRNRAQYAPHRGDSIILWTMSTAWLSPRPSRVKRGRGSAWIGHRYLEYKTGQVVAGELACDG